MKNTLDNLTPSDRQRLVQLARSRKLKRKENRPLPAITPAPRDEVLPLSFAQQRLWFLDHLEGAGAAYHKPNGLRLKGVLDRAALVRALDRIVARHEALRTTFVMRDGEPAQQIAAADCGLALRDHDLRGVGDGETELARLAAEEASAPFDLGQGPLIRGRLVRLAADEHALLVTMHHIVSDGWSMGVLTSELSALYAAFSQGLADPLPPLAVQYVDYAAWQRQWLAGEVLQRQAEYWQNALADAPALLTLPSDRPRPVRQDYAGTAVAVRLDGRLSQALKALSLRHGLTLQMTLLAGWAALLSRLSGQAEVVIGSPVANRSRAEIEGLIGFFVNTVALRLDVSGSLAELMARTKAVSLAAQANQDLPFEQVVELVQPPRSLSHAAVFQAMFAWQNAPQGTLALPGLTLSVLASGPEAAKFDLTLSLGEAGSEIAGSLSYATALFDRATVERWLGYWVRLLEAMVSDAEVAVDRVALLGTAERHRVVVEWNATEAEYPKDKCIHELFEAQAERTPDAVAVVYEDQQLSYAELNARSNRLAHYLRGLGVKPDDRLAICVERSLEMVVGLLAILKAGGAYVPLDPAYPPERLRYMLADSAPKLVLTHAATRSVVEAVLHGEVEIVDVGAGWSEGWTNNVHPADIGLSPANLAYVIYTSGSTGAPKGVMIQHRSLVSSTMARKATYGTLCRFLLLSPFSFDSSVAGIFGVLANGGELFVATATAIRDPVLLGEDMRRWKISTILCVPSLYRQLLATRERGYECLSKVIVAGEPCPPELIAKSAQLEPRIQIFNEYGPTETTVWTSVHRCNAPIAGNVPIGRPIANTRMYILDARGAAVPVGVTGEIHIGGVGVARGYLNRPDLTAERFVPDPFAREPGSRLYRTGDLGRWLTDGNIEFVGRNDDQVKIRGYRIELGEIEARLVGHADVDEAVVVAREDEPGDKRLVAYYTGDAEVGIGAEELRHHLSTQFPDYMVPAAYVRLDALPLTPNGKLHRRALPVPGGEAYVARVYEAPQGAVEEQLAAIWAELLQLERIGRHDNFFELGGHSLKAVQLVSRLRQVLKVEVVLSSLFARPVLMDFAATIASASASTLPAIEAVAREGAALPLSFAQQRLWFLSQLQPESTFYNMPSAARLVGRLDVEALRRTLNEVVRRHETLRTHFAFVDGSPVQVIASELELALPVTDLSGLSVAERDARVEEAARIESATPFDLAQGPLVRTSLLRLGIEEHIALVTMHHIVSDGWSMGVLINEVAALYRAYKEGSPSPLPELTIQYADYAHWQRELFSGDVLDKQLSYWKEQLSGAPPLLALPTDRPRPVVQRSNGNSRSIVLPPQRVTALYAWSEERQVTLFMTLLTILKIVLFRWSGQSDIVVGTVVAGRAQAAIEPLIGCFMNFLPLRDKCAAGETAASLLKRLTGTVLEAYSHQDCPFEKIIEVVNPERDTSHNPVFNVGFLLQNYPHKALELSELTLKLLPIVRQDSALDLRFVAEENADGLELACEYNTDLFDPETVAAVLDACEQVLAQVVAREETLLKDFRLPEALHKQAEAATKRNRNERLAVASTFTAEPIEPALRFWVDKLGIASQIEFAPYNQIFQTLLDPQSLFQTNREGVNLILLRLEDWIREAPDGANPQDHFDRMDRNADDLVEAAAFAVRQASVPVLVLFGPVSHAFQERPAYRAFFTDLERRLIVRLQAIAGVYPISSERLSKLYPVTDYEDRYTDKIGHVPYKEELYAALGTLAARGIMALRRRPYKVVVLDCDETLWKGICGEVGPSGVEVTAGHKALQRFMVALQEAGMLLCLCSKNNPDDVDAVFAVCGEMELKQDHIIASRINWRPKSENVRALAQELKLGLDSFIFIDDNAIECSEVEASCPDVLVLQLPSSPELIPHFLDHVWAFDELGGKATVQRTQQYRQNQIREAVRSRAASFEDFLKNLELRVSMESVQDSDLERVAELTQRTNQFNVNPAPRNAAEIRASSERYLAVQVHDRFGSYGLTGVVSYAAKDDVLEVGTFLLSCRVLGRGVEQELLKRLCGLGAEAGCRMLVVPYQVTGRNQPALSFFEKVADAGHSALHFALPVEQAEVLVPTAEVAAEEQQDVAPADAVATATVLKGISLIREISADLGAIPQILGRIRAAARRTSVSKQGYVAPRTQTEAAVAEIWAAVLKRERVGLHDNFFAIGGHSLLAVVVLSRVRKGFGIELPLTALFEAPTVLALAERIEAAQGQADAIPAPAIEAVAREGALPLSFAQQRLWFVSQLEGASAAYHVAGGLRLKGKLDWGALLRALDRIVARHEALRTTFVLQDGEAAQRIAAAESGFALIEHDLSGAADGTAELGRLVAAETAPFDLAQGPLIRGRLVRLAEDDHALLVTMHHIVSDGWSMGVLTRELGALYAAFVRGEEDPLAPLAVQYADYAVWQRRWLGGEVLQRQAAYWKQQLAGAPVLLTLPADHGRPAQMDYAGASVGVRLDAELTEALKALSLRHGLTLHMTLLASFAALLGRLSGQDEVVIGSPVANRSRAEIEGLIGFFVNTVALRLDTSGSLAELMARAKAVSLAAQENQDLPFEQVVELVQPPRSLSHAAVFQAMFAWQNAPQGTLALPGLRLSALASGSEAAQFDLTLSLGEMELGEGRLGEAGTEIAGSLTYATALFDRETVERWLGYWVRLLEVMVSDANVAVERVALLSAAERSRLLVEWNATAAAYPADRCLHELFEAQVSRTADAIAVVYEDRHLSYGELNARANRLAHHLIGLGVKPDARVAICVERSIEMVVGLLAILKAGGAYVPLDPTYPDERLAYMLEDSAPKVVLAHKPTLPVVGAVLRGEAAVVDIDVACSEGYADNPDPRQVGLSAANLAYVIYTSGSTGQPKGVLVEHRSIQNLLTWYLEDLELQCDDAVLLATSHSFDLTQKNILGSLAAGARLHLAGSRFDPAAIARLVSDEQITHLNMSPSAFNALIDANRVQALPSLRRVVLGGEPIKIAPLKLLAEPRPQIINSYGPTEGTDVVAWFRSAADLDRYEAQGLPLGRPIRNLKLYVLDTCWQPVPVGMVGEMYIGGVGVARGYLNRPDLTAERFVADPFAGEPGARMYRTGDLGRHLADGNIEFLGRNDFQVKIHGFRIELGEIEARLADHHDVQGAVVVARGDGPGDQRLVAYYTGAEDLSAQALRSHMAALLPDYMVPAAYVWLERLPLTANGKLDRKALPTPADGAYASRGYEAPQGELEEKLAALWAELLGVARVGRHDNFFELGGHSLLAVQLVERIGRHLNAQISISEMFLAPQLDQLAEKITNVKLAAFDPEELSALMESLDEVD
jgi:amino acid adenylation domain-containing protein/FkbH-like protein